jgi:Ca2+-transporting ATPase
VRFGINPAFTRDFLTNKNLFIAFGAILLISVLITELNFMQKIFGTVPLTGLQWGISLLLAISALIIAELGKYGYRLTHRKEIESGLVSSLV